jgi:hypothetical protein
MTDVSKCLRGAYAAYSDPSVYQNPRGPNSNTFAATLAKACCADSSSTGLGSVPGWDQSPAPPCPTALVASGGAAPMAGPAPGGISDAGAPDASLPGGVDTPPQTQPPGS